MRYDTVETNGLDEQAPLIYQIDVRIGCSTETYIGQSVLGSIRPRVDHLRSASKCLEGLPFRHGNPDGYQLVHRRMAEAARGGGSLHLILVENAPLDVLTDREHFWFRELSATLNVAHPRGGGPKSTRPTPKRLTALEDLLRAADWRAFRSQNGARFGAAREAYAGLNGISRAEAEQELIRMLTEKRRQRRDAA